MFLSIGRSLRRGFSFRFGFRLKGWAGGIMAIMYAMFYLCWWCMLGSLYLVYGACYVCLYLPIKGIVKLVKDRQRA